MIIDRYIVREVVKPLLTITAILLIIFVGYSSGRYLSDAVNGLLPVNTLASLIMLRAAIASEVLLPVALYLSVVIGLGRLDADHEITALVACGIGIKRVYRVVFFISLLLAAVVALLSLYGRPLAYEQSYWLQARADAEIDFDKLEAGSFYSSEHRQRTLFVEDIEHEHGRMQGIFMRSERDGMVRITRGEEGYQLIDPVSARQSLVLLDAHVYELRLNGTKDKLGTFGELTVYLKEPEPVTVGYKRKAAPTLELTGSAAPADIAELQWRFSTPISTLLLGFLGVLMSRSARGRSRYTKTLAAIVIYAVYYNTSAMAKTWVQTGVVGTFPGIWWVQMLLATLVLWAIVQPRQMMKQRRSNRAAQLAGQSPTKPGNE